MGIRVSCPNGHKLNVKEHLAGKRGICPTCRATFVIPAAGESRPAEPVAVDAGSLSAQVSRSGFQVSPAAKSVVIPVVEPMLTAAPAIMSPPQNPAPPAALVFPPTLVQQVQAAPQSPDVPPPVVVQPNVAISKAAESPSARFMSRRMRSRRNQTTLAIALLVAVIVLAGVLIWVLSRGPAASGDVAHTHISFATHGYYADAGGHTMTSGLTSARL